MAVRQLLIQRRAAGPSSPNTRSKKPDTPKPDKGAKMAAAVNAPA